MNELKSVDGKKMAHDIANALSPALNYPDRVKIIDKKLEYGFECLRYIYEAMSDREQTIADQFQNDDIREKLVPALAELYRLGEENLELYRLETRKLSQQLEKMSALVAGYRSSITAKQPSNNSTT